MIDLIAQFLKALWDVLLPLSRTPCRSCLGIGPGPYALMALRRTAHHANDSRS